MPSKDRILRERIKNHLEERRVENQSIKTLESAEYVLNRWMKGLIDAGLELNPKKMGERELRIVFDIFRDNHAHKAITKKSRCKKPELNPETSDRYRFWCLSFVQTFLKREGNKNIEKVRIVKPQNMTIMRDWLDTKQEEEQLVWKYLSEKGTPIQRALIALELGAGYRRVEVMRLKLKDVHPTRLDVKGKGRAGGKQRTTYLAPSVRAALEPWLDQRSGMVSKALKADPQVEIPPEVFIHNHGKGGKLSTYSESGLDGILERVLIGMEAMFGRDFTFSHHTMRRTLGRKLHKKKQPIENISKILGHESTTTTLDYIGVDLDDQEESFNALEEEYAQKPLENGHFLS